MKIRRSAAGKGNRTAVGAPGVAIVKRELLTSLRRRRTFFWMLLLVVVGSLTVLSVWPVSVRLGTSMAEIGRFSRVVFQYAVVAVAACLALLVPGMASASVIVEKKTDTFDFLKLSLIGPRGIVFGKLMNTIGVILLLLTAAFPLFSATLFLVGLDWIEVSTSLGFLVLTALMCAMIGIFCSTKFKHVLTAAVFSYIVVAFFLGGWVPLLYACMELFNTHVDGDLIPISACPAFILLEPRFGSTSLVGAVVYELAVTAIFAMLSVRSVFRHEEPTKVDAAPPIEDPQLLWDRRHRFPFYLIDPLRRKKEIDDRRNPMFIKEMRCGVMSKGVVMFRLFYISLLAYFLIGTGWVIVSDELENVGVLIMVEMGIALFIIPAFLAGAFAKEHEQENHDVLRMTLLSPSQVVMGKAYAGFVYALPMILASFIATMPCVFLVGGILRTFIYGYTAFAVCCYLCIAIGLLTSVLTKKTVSAYVLGYALNALLFIGTRVLLEVWSVVYAHYRNWMDHPGPMFLSPMLALRYTMGEAQIRNPEGTLVYFAANMITFAGLAWVCIRVAIYKYKKGMVDR